MHKNIINIAILLSMLILNTSCLGGGSSAGTPITPTPPEGSPTPPVTPTPPTNPGTLALSPSSGNITISSYGTVQSLNNLMSNKKNSAATLLNDGRLLITGGWSNSAIVGTLYYTNSEIYDLGSSMNPTPGNSTQVANMQYARYEHKMITLNDNRVLILGGRNGSGPVAFAEIYNPANNSTTIINEGGCATTLSGSVTGTKLQDGSVLILGTGTSAEIFDPTTGIHGCFQPTGSSNHSRSGLTATLLQSGKVLVIGGSESSGDLYDPASGQFDPTASSMAHSRYQHAATLLADGRVLIAGGFNSNLDRLNTALTYNELNDSFTPVGNMAIGRNNLTLAALTAGPLSGHAVLLGGTSVAGVVGQNGTVAVELFNHNTNTFSTLPIEVDPVGLVNHTSTVANGSRIVVAGGWNSGSSNVTMLNTNMGARISISASGGTAPYNFSLSPAHGSISGNYYVVPTTTNTVTLTVTDANNDTQNATLNLIL